MKKLQRKTKDEKRRVLLNKKTEVKQARIVKYGSDSVAVVAKDVNRRFIAAFLALVFVLTTLVIGVNFISKAAPDDDDFNMYENIDDSGLVLRKGLKDNGDGTFDLKMEAYATQNLARKTLDEDTPVDVVMVLPQGTSMSTTDVLQGYKASNSTSFTINDARTKYVLDDGVYYPLAVDNDVYAVVHDNNGTPINSWTAQSAQNWINTNSRNLYYMNGSTPTQVATSKDYRYTTSSNVTQIDLGASYIDHSLFRNSHNALTYRWGFLNSNSEDVYVYVPDNNGNGCWHRVYYQEDGELSGSEWGFYYTFYYYTNSVTGTGAPQLTGGNAGDTFGSGNSQITLLCDYHECGVWGLGLYTTTGDKIKYWKNNTSGNNLSDGKFYARGSTSSTINKMTAGNYVLACPQPNGTDSHPYEDVLYTKGYQLYYTKNGQRINVGDAVQNETDIAVPSGTLYEEYKVSRQDALKAVANQFAEQIAQQAASDNLEHRMAVVGYADNGSILPTPTTATDALFRVDANDESGNGVNDSIDTAINSLSATGGNNLTAGLNTAGNVFNADSTDNKRIVVVFTDADTNVSNDALAASNTLKDHYNATVYAIRLYNSEPNATVETNMHKLSSEYFYNTETGDGTYYFRAKDAYNDINGLPIFDIEPLADAFEAVSEASLQSDSITTSLGASNSLLKDIISKDFIVPQNPAMSAYIVPVDDFDQDTGAPVWDDENKQLFTLDNTNHSVVPNNDGTTSISINGFDYSSNYVSESRATISDGKKLVVTISGLRLKDNVDTESDRRIYSNTKNSGLYKHGAEDLLIAAFPRPFVDKTTNLVPNGTSGVQNGNVVVNKYLTANENGNYDLTLEAYSTARNETSTITEKIPTDFVVVVDQSASMQEADMPTGDATLRNNVNLETVATGNYFYYDEASGEYYKVYGVKDYLYRYYPENSWFTGDIVEHFGTKLRWFMGETDTTKNINNAFYFREEVNGKGYYQPISSTIVGRVGAYMMTFKYTSIAGNEVEFNREDTTYSSNGKSPWYKNVLNGDVMNSGALWSAANAAVQLVYPRDNEYSYSTLNLGLIRPRTGMYINYPMYERHVAYTKLCYRDVNGVEHVLQSNQNNGQSTWEYCDDNGFARSAKETNSARPTYSNLYTFDTTQTRIAALKTALTEFAQAVADEEDYYGHVDNKVSIIGFSSDPANYSNTELLTGTTFQIQRGSEFPSTSNGYSEDGYNYNGKMKNAATSADYAGALVSSTEGNNVGVVNGKLTQAIAAITAYGGTQPEDGLDMAKSVLDNRVNKTYTLRSVADTTVDRNTVVIFFTDGQPGNYHYSNQYQEANDVVESAKRIKADGTSIFSIGVFGESDGNPLTYRETNLQDPYDDPAYWEYMGGYVETYQANGTYYCLRRQWRPGNSDYTEIANDTIYDYMSVTSSNYPDAKDFIAPAWLNGSFNGNYIAATDGDTVRQKSTAEGTNKYYRMASSQSTLIEAFLQAITMSTQPIESDGTLGPSTILRDILENDNFEMTSSTTYTVETAKGKADSNGVVTFENEKTAITLAPPPSLGSDEIEVTGFDYATNSIYYGKPADTDNDLSEHQGRKLIVTLTNVVPKQLITSDQNDDRIFSNEDASGLWKNVQVAAFPKPAITRHSYTLDVGDDNKNAQFNVTTTLVAGSGASDDLSDVILVKPDGTRTPYNEVEDVSFTMGDGQTFYYENVPPGYTVKASTRAPDSFYTYTFWADNETNKDTLSTNSNTNRTLDYSDHVLHVTSVSSYRDVTIAESVSGDYANTSDVFSVKLTLIPPNNDPYNESTIALANDVTLERKGNGSYEGTITDLPGDQNEKQLRVPAGWTLKVEPIAHERYDVDTGYPKYNTEEDSTQIVLPNEGVVITSDLTNIFINNVAKDIPPEGILNSSSHNYIIYILAALAGLAAIGGGIFLWKKKDEFVEE